MKFVIVLLIIVIVAVVGVKFGMEYIKVENAKARVKNVFNGLREGTGKITPEVQKAVSMWYDGSPSISDQNTLGHASNQFDAWLRKKNLNKKITQYKISQATLVKGSDPPVVIVSCMIEGKPFTMQVPKNDRISWID